MQYMLLIYQREADLGTLSDKEKGAFYQEYVAFNESTKKSGHHRAGALHAQAARAGDTDWPQIAALYEVLFRLHPSPVIELNRAAAVAMAEGPQHGLRLIEALEARGDLHDYHLLPAARADLLRRLRRWADAANAYRRALALVANEPERRFLARRLAEADTRARTPLESAG